MKINHQSLIPARQVFSLIVLVGAGTIYHFWYKWYRLPIREQEFSRSTEYPLLWLGS